MTNSHVANFHHYQDVRGFSDKTIRRREGSLRQFAAAIDPLPLLAATGDLVDEWLGTFRSPATRHAYRADLMAFYAWATKRDIVDANPVVKTDSIKVPKTLPRPVPPAYLSAVLASAPPDVRLMIGLAAYAGLRCAEIAAIEASDIDLTSESPTLAVRAGKGNKDRIVPVHPALAVLLREQYIRSGRLVQVGTATVGIKISTHLRSLGIEATAHKLRHSFGTELARSASGNIVLVAALMGHGSVETSMRYVGWQGGPSVEAISGMYPPAA